MGKKIKETIKIKKQKQIKIKKTKTNKNNQKQKTNKNNQNQKTNKKYKIQNQNKNQKNKIWTPSLTHSVMSVSRLLKKNRLRSAKLEQSKKSLCAADAAVNYDPFWAAEAFKLTDRQADYERVMARDPN